MSFITLFLSYYFYPLINQPTRVHAEKKSIIDNIFTNSPNIIIIIIIIYLYCIHTVYIHIRKMLNIYKNSNKNNINKVSQSKIMLISITLIFTIAEWESEYKQ